MTVMRPGDAGASRLPRVSRHVVTHRPDAGTLRALPHALVYLTGYLLLRPLVRVRCEPRTKLPERSLVYGFHEILLLGILSSRFTRPIVWVNNDTPGGLASAVPALLSGIRIFRLGVGSPVPQYEQLRAFLKAMDVPVGLFTDAGRRDGRIRRSLVSLAVDSQRPLVPLAITVSRYRLVDGQVYPLPFATITVRYGTPIPATDVAELSSEKARELLLDRLTATERAAR
jgi:hypothetical protein